MHSVLSVDTSTHVYTGTGLYYFWLHIVAVQGSSIIVVCIIIPTSRMHYRKTCSTIKFSQRNTAANGSVQSWADHVTTPVAQCHDIKGSSNWGIGTQLHTLIPKKIQKWFMKMFNGYMRKVIIIIIMHYNKLQVCMSIIEVQS